MLALQQCVWAASATSAVPQPELRVPEQELPAKKSELLVPQPELQGLQPWPPVHSDPEALGLLPKQQLRL
eukprot:2735547-Lingulodinium_polyedra.AAC.1